MASRLTEWRRLPVSLTELCIATTLRCGQSFRWKHDVQADTYTCTLRGRIVQLKQDAQGLEYRSAWPAAVSSVAQTKSARSKEASKGTTGKRKRAQNYGVDRLLTPPSSATTSTHEADLVDEADTPRSDRKTSVQSTILEDDTRALITHYLNLGPNLSDLYSQWSSADANFKKKAPRFTGVRILRQDSWEALVCFICSSNNNIARIGQMVDKLCAAYGPCMGSLPHNERDGLVNTPLFDFPDPDRLIGDDVEGQLRQLGFGYRARYIAETARLVHERGGRKWLDSLRNPEAPAYETATVERKGDEMKPEGRDGYRIAHEMLLELQGVGPKVADCVCLMGLAWGEAVPVDTHVWQIAQRDYKFGKGKHSSLTKVTYDAVANHFRKLWGQEAGWAHSVLFTADLRAFADRLTTPVETKVKVEVQQPLVKIEADDEARDPRDEKKVTRTAVTVKHEVDEATADMKPRIEIDAVAMTSSERVKRRRRR